MISEPDLVSAECLWDFKSGNGIQTRKSVTHGWIPANSPTPSHISFVKKHLQIKFHVFTGFSQIYLFKEMAMKVE